MSPRSNRILIAVTALALIWSLVLTVQVEAQRRKPSAPPVWTPALQGSVPSDFGPLVSVSVTDTKNYVLAFRSDDGEVHLLRVVSGQPPTPENYIMKLTRD